MPKMTVLDMVQHILSDMNEDLVNSIDDTQISYSTAIILKDTFAALVSERVWPTHQSLVPLEAVSDNTYPTYMRIPDNVNKIHWFKYNVKDQMSDATGLDNYQDMVYLDPETFIGRSHSLNPASSNVITVEDNLTTSQVRLLFTNDAAPSYWTSFDDEYIIVDSYNATYDDTLQAQKSLIYADLDPSFSLSDTFTPDIPSQGFPLLLSEAKKSAFIKIKQVADQSEAERARRQRTWLAGEKHRTRNKGVTYPDYGRN